MVVAQDACRGANLQVLINIMESHGFTRVEVDSSNNGPVAAWTEGTLELSDIIYFINSDIDVDGKSVLVPTATGYANLSGLNLIGGVGEICVEISYALTVSKILGSDTSAVHRELLGFPGFGSIDQTLERLTGKSR